MRYIHFFLSRTNKILLRLSTCYYFFSNLHRGSKCSYFALDCHIFILHVFFFLYKNPSKFCRGSLFLIFWLLQPQFVLNLFLFLWAIWNDEKSKQKDQALKNNTDRLYNIIINGKLCFCFVTLHIANVNYKIQ